MCFGVSLDGDGESLETTGHGCQQLRSMLLCSASDSKFNAFFHFTVGVEDAGGPLEVSLYTLWDVQQVQDREVGAKILHLLGDDGVGWYVDEILNPSPDVLPLVLSITLHLLEGHQLIWILG